MLRRFLGGRIVSALASDGRRGYLLGLACETDFLARTDPFLELARDLADHAARSDPDGLRDGERPLLRQRLGRRGSVEQALEAAGSEFGEVLRLTRFERLASPAGRVGAYVHHDHRVGALVALVAASRPEELDRVSRDLCLHVVAFAPARLGDEHPARDPAPDSLLDQPWIHEPSLGVRAALVRELGPTARIEGFRIVRLGIP